jgi:DNA-binding transcriptional LysR family regulator
VATVPRFSIAFEVLAQSNAVAIAPSRLARHQARRFGLSVHALPVPLEPIRVLAVRRPGADLGVGWLLETIKSLGEVH